MENSYQDRHRVFHLQHSQAGCRIDNCDSCFSKDFCTKCKSGFYLHKGHCFDECPEGFSPSESMECMEGCEVGPWSEWGTCSRRNKTCGYKWGLETRTRHIVKKPPKDTMPCPTIAESRRCRMAMRHCTKEGCEVGPWSEWGTCSRRNKTCGYKWGLETRTRHIVKKPPKDTMPCPTIAESRRCRMAMRHCTKGKILLLLLLLGSNFSDLN
ncbi:R-spondin-2 [Acipenser ruthenus]|uniref:R-spondin-2 n=1 Tax=Acipenser ruthenus TaxID=7906 RepID=A0A444TWP3_ACIRT|nr:R-spondin-2 [Acipenser ruthenus]